MRAFIFLMLILGCQSAFAAVDPELAAAIERARTSCSGISDEFDKLKTMAGINTAVTAVGTATGGGAIATGFIKQSTDKKIKKLELERLHKITMANATPPQNAPGADILAAADAYYEIHKNDTPDQIQSEIDRLSKKSKHLGNWRTGLLAGNTVTQVAGAIIAGKNKASSDLKGAIADCVAAVSALPAARTQASMLGADAAQLDLADKIASACGDWRYVDVSKINNRATGSMWSSIAGAGIATAGTITSAMANTDKTRAGNDTREKNLNTTSNIMSIGATAASATATIFNASQIAAIKKAADVADKCQEALK